MGCLVFPSRCNAAHDVPVFTAFESRHTHHLAADTHRVTIRSPWCPFLSLSQGKLKEAAGAVRKAEEELTGQKSAAETVARNAERQLKTQREEASKSMDEMRQRLMDTEVAPAKEQVRALRNAD